MPEKFIETIENLQSEFGLNLAKDKIERLAVFYELVQKHNPILHLVAPAPEEEFAVRHILESLTLLEFLPAKSSFADVGAGAGLPSIPCLLAREDLRGVLIESKLKKAAFLQEVLKECDLENRTSIINRQFEEISAPRVAFVTCRALDKFTQKLPKLLKWSKGAQMLFFGGNALREQLRENRVKFREKLMPYSEQRYLFIGQI
ncbi:MAG TPA: 16S rRNA (guanine(527)-N(7))-methyltransferase RsmG [Pyrinomonadaceae bacterium]|jgi:16S rRNA (guanine527-N7)-methyltransferase